MAELALRGLTKRFGDVPALQGLELTVADGEFVVLLGPSGAGKTTTLRLAAGLEAPDAGTVRIGGQDMTAAAPALRDVAFVFQQYSLYPHLNVFDNLAFPLRSPLRPLSAAAIQERVGTVARMLRIDDKLQQSVTRLSGGQMQRVAIGRALVRSPAVYLMDEPLSSLDAKLRHELRLELKRIQQDLGATVLYVTHDQTEAMTLANRIGVLERGRLVQVGTPQQVYEDPASSQVAQRLGTPRINLLPRAALGDCAAPTAAASVGVRAEDLRLDPGALRSGGLRARVQRIELLSDQRLLHLKLLVGDHALVSAAPAERSIAAGDEVGVELARALWFDADGRRIATA